MSKENEKIARELLKECVGALEELEGLSFENFETLKKAQEFLNEKE